MSKYKSPSKIAFTRRLLGFWKWPVIVSHTQTHLWPVLGKGHKAFIKPLHKSPREEQYGNWNVFICIQTPKTRSEKHQDGIHLLNPPASFSPSNTWAVDSPVRNKLIRHWLQQQRKNHLETLLQINGKIAAELQHTIKNGLSSIVQYHILSSQEFFDGGAQSYGKKIKWLENNQQLTHRDHKLDLLRVHQCR